MARARIRVEGGVGGGLQAFLGATMSAYSGCCERDGGIRRSKRCSRTELVRVCGDVQLAGWRVSGGRAPSGGERQRSESSEGATELGFPGPTLGQMQSEAARRAGEPSDHGKEAASQGLGGHDLLAQTDARRPACQVVGDHLHRQPGAVGGEAARGEMVQPHCPASTIFAGWRQSVLPVHLLGLDALLGSVGAVAGDVKLQDDGVVHDPVNRRGGGHGVGKDALPLGEDQV